MNDMVDENSGRVHLFGVDAADGNKFVNFRDGGVTGGGHGDVEVAHRFAESKIAAEKQAQKIQHYFAHASELGWFCRPTT